MSKWIVGFAKVAVIGGALALQFRKKKADEAATDIKQTTKKASDFTGFPYERIREPAPPGYVSPEERRRNRQKEIAEQAVQTACEQKRLEHQEAEAQRQLQLQQQQEVERLLLRIERERVSRQHIRNKNRNFDWDRER